MSATPSDRVFTGTTILGNYACPDMFAIWQTAKCANFVHNSNFNEDGFMPLNSLRDLAGNPDISGYIGSRDTRRFPSPCSGPTSSMFATWDASHTAIANFQNTSFQTPLAAIFTDVGNKLRPGSCGAAISTGVTVIVGDGSTHADGICTNPGCTYQSGGSCS